ncbi:peroxisomal membrane protein, putative [Eimeria mitis]|uniref:Peroxisomal membrane protein, putative n=1 Tax=Eimeria mitis TaxID=44415 RepID=U6K9T2_9EIME|nr:peroxisomal membrane protein, putative [Eimeria mitis]CDJ34719.1 peroxisomal membrane protein, putative [Eimeria mitis]
MSDATHAFLHTVAGAAGAVVAMAVVYPLDSLRTIQSVQGGSAWDVVKLHLRHGGWRRLYRGIKAALAGVVFSWGTYFFVYTLAKQKEKNRRGHKAKTGTNLPMAIGAGICSTVISNPFWVANTRLKVDFSAKANEQGIFKMLIAILRKEGFRGWLAGIVPALVLVLNPAIQFTLYDHLRVKLMQLKQRWRTASRASSSNSLSSQHSSTGSLVSDKMLRVRVTPAESFLMGLTAKLAATLVTYPYLVVKTRAQSKVYNVKDYSCKEGYGIARTSSRLSALRNHHPQWTLNDTLTIRSTSSICSCSTVLCFSGSYCEEPDHDSRDGRPSRPLCRLAFEAHGHVVVVGDNVHSV